MARSRPISNAGGGDRSLLGRDVLSRIIYGARVSLVVGLSATSVNMMVALLIGTTTGFFGGKLDMVVQRFVDAWMVGLVVPGRLSAEHDSVRGARPARRRTWTGAARRRTTW